MLTLITGAPGAGKTLNSLAMVDKEFGETRPIYYAGIRELTLPGWKEISYDEARQWQTFDDGCIFVIDECDLFAGNTAADRKTEPEFVRELARHRHRGMDFFFITQSPTRLHYSVRHHIGRHIHFERGFGREATRKLEWQKCVDDPKDDYHARKEAGVTRIKFPKKYYDVYKSAEVHTHKPRTPKMVWAVLGGFILVALLGAKLAFSLTDRKEALEEQVANAQDSEFPDGFSSIPGFDNYISQAESFIPGIGEDAPKTAAELVFEQEPRFQDQPWSAPQFDHLTEVQSYPRPQCIHHVRSGNCKCFTQQATPLAISLFTCREIVRTGYFNPFIEDIALNQPASAASGEAVSAPAARQPTDEPLPIPNPYSQEQMTFVADIDSSTIRLGGAYRNKVSSVATRPRQP